MNIVDYLGELIKAGDYIVRPDRRGSYLGLVLSKVESVNDNGTLTTRSENGTTGTVLRTDRVVVVDALPSSITSLYENQTNQDSSGPSAKA